MLKNAEVKPQCNQLLPDYVKLIGSTFRISGNFRSVIASNEIVGIEIYPRLVKYIETWDQFSKLPKYQKKLTDCVYWEKAYWVNL